MADTAKEQNIICPNCREHVRLTKDGRLEAHATMVGTEPEEHYEMLPCQGSGQRMVAPPLEAADLLLALTKRETLIELLNERDLPWRTLPDDHPDYPGEILFELGGEQWLAVYRGTRYFKILGWS